MKADDRSGPALLMFRVLLAAASVVVGYGVFAPAGTAPSVMPWDKAEHFTAFYGLAFLAVFAFPRTSVWWLAAILSASGAAIELIQALPFVHRDSDVWDWVADSLGIAAAIAPLEAARWRRGFAG